MNHLIKRTYLFTGICCLLLCLFPVGLSQDATESSTQMTSTETEVTNTTTETTESTATETTKDTDSSSTAEAELDATDTSEVAEETMTEESESATEKSEPVIEETTEESQLVIEEATEESEPVEPTNEESSNVESEEVPATETETSGDESLQEDATGQNEEEFGVESTEEIPNTEALEEPEEESDAETSTSEEESAEASDGEFTTEDAADTTETTDVGNEQANQRVITVDYSGGNRKAVDFRYGPWIYTHPDEEGVVGTVGTDEDSQLTIYAKEAELKAPEEVLIATAGERVANFTGGVRVERKRLTAIGEALEYSEETGFGELSAEDRIDITVLPKENDGDTTTITAAAATFDVDTDVSVSRGQVTLESGTQSAEAEEITFEQGLDLAVMTSPDGQVIIKRVSDEGELIITADIVRVLTESKKLMASGNVTLVDGSITTTGEVVFFDDAIERAEIFGTPENLAVSIDSEFDVTLKGQRLEQRIDLDLAQILDETAETIWDEVDFLLTSETSTE